jgi:hypothetical protein
MKLNKSITAAAIAGLFAGAAATAGAAAHTNAGETGVSANSGSTITLAGFGKTSVNFMADGAKHDCKGKNDCKGKGGCKSGDNGCKGKNSCKGKGGCATDGKKG